MASLLSWIGKKVQQDVVTPVSHAIGNTVNAGATAARDVGGAAQATGRFVMATPKQNVVAPFVGNLARGTVSQAGALGRSAYDIGRGAVASATGNNLALQHANQAKQKDEGQFIQPFARPAIQAVRTVEHPFSPNSYQAKGRNAQIIFGKAPVQNIAAGVQSNYREHPNLPMPQRIGLAGAYGAGQVAQDALLLAGAKKGATTAAKDASAVVKKAAPVVKKAAVQANERAFTPRANLEDQYTLRDFSDYRSGAYQPRPGELNHLLAKVREVGQKHGVDLVNGTPAQQIDRANSILDQIGKRNREISQGGYVRISRGGGAEANSPGGKVPKQIASTPSKVPSTPNVSSALPRTLRGKLSVQKLPKLPGVQSGKTEMPKVRQVGVSSANSTTLPATLPVIGKTRLSQSKLLTSKNITPDVKQALDPNYQSHSFTAQREQIAKSVTKNLTAATDTANRLVTKDAGTMTDAEHQFVSAVAAAQDATGTKAGQQLAESLYGGILRHRTATGQTFAAFREMANDPNILKVQATNFLKNKNIELKPEEKTQLDGLIKTLRGTQLGTPERDLALHNVISFVTNKVPSSMGDKIVNFWRAGLLTSPITTGGNILGNTGEAIVRNVWTNPVATGVDALQSLVTGRRTKTLAGGQFRGGVQGVKDSAAYLKTGFDKNNPLTKFEGNGDLNYGEGRIGRTIGGYVNGVYRGLGAQDKPFRQAAANQATIDLAKADAKNQKLTGRVRAAYIDKALNTPGWQPKTFKTANDSKAAGAFAVFANETALGKTAALIKQPFTINGRHFGGAIRQFVLPFSQVPASIAMRIIHRSDLGATEIVNQILKVRKGAAYDQRAVSEAIGNGTFGPAAIGAGYALSKSGAITGNYPTDQKEQEIWKSQGKQANSVKIGNRWYSLNYMQPFGTLLGIGDQIRQDEKAGKTPTEIVSNATGRAAKSIESQSFLQGINGLLSAVNDPQRSASKYINSTASSVVPNFIRTAARATDPLQRDTKNPVDALKGTIPGVRESLPASQDMFGRNLPAPDNALNQAFNPLRPSIIRNDPVVNELGRLQEAGQGIIPTQFNKTSIPGQKLTNDQVRQLQTLIGTPTYQAYQQIMNDPRYAALSDEQKKAVLSGAGAKQSDAYKRVFSTDNNIPLTTTPSKATQTILTGGAIDYLAPKTPKTAKVATTAKPKTTKVAKTTVRKAKKLPTTYFKTASAIKAPSIPKVKIRKPVAFRAPGIKKLSVKKLPTNFKQRKLA